MVLAALGLGPDTEGVAGRFLGEPPILIFEFGFWEVPACSGSMKHEACETLRLCVQFPLGRPVEQSLKRVEVLR